jgi:hypothetical protein
MPHGPVFGEQVDGTDGIHEELGGYIKRIRPYPPLALRADLFIRRIARGITRRLARAARGIGAVAPSLQIRKSERRNIG